MSELINRVVDIEAIAKQVDDTKKILSEIQTKIDEINKNSLNIIPDVRAAKNADELSNATKRLNDNIVKGNSEMNVYNEMQKQLEAQEKKYVQALATSQTQQSKSQQSLNQLTKANKEQNEQLKQEAILNDKNAGTIEKLTAQNKLLEAEKKKLNLATKEGNDRLKEINEAQDKNNEVLNEANNKLQQQKNNVGNYKSALEGLNTGFKSNFVLMQNLINKSGGLSGAFETGKTAVSAFGKQLLVLLANPIIAIIAGIVAVFMLLKNAISSNGEATKKLGIIMAPFKLLMTGIQVVLGKLASVVMDGVLAIGKLAGAVASLIPGLSKINEKAKEAINLKKEEQKLNSDIREQIVSNAKDELAISELRNKSREKDKYSTQERIKFLKDANDLELKMNKEKVDIATRQFELKKKQMAEEGKSFKDLTSEEKTAYKESEAKIYETRKEYFDNTMRLKSQLATAIKEINNDEKERNERIAKENEDRAKKQLEAQRMFIDSQLAIMEEGAAKEIAISDEKFKRQIEDLKASGEYTKKLGANLEIAHQKEIQKIKENYAKTEEQRQKDEMEKVYANFEKSLQKEISALSDAEKQKEIELKKAYARGEISKQEYEAKLLQIQNDAAKEANDKTIELLKDELDTAQLTDDKRAEFSKRLSDLQIANENAAADAAIKANNDKLESEKATAEKRKKIATDLVNASFDLFSSIADFQKQESENRLAEIDIEQSKSDDYFASRQANLDNAMMSDEARAAAQEKLDSEKAKKDAELEKKKKAERLKQAKWEKAQALVSATIGTALSVMNALQTQPFIVGVVLAAMAAAIGAIQIAKIASQPISAYAKGGVTKNEVALWGEKQPEVAVTTTGEVMFAENPTISKFDAGTRIYKSVSDFENYMSSKTNDSFTFDYDKMAKKMPKNEIHLDATGLWSIATKEGERRKMINRRIKL